MTVAALSSKADYLENGVTLTFPLPFRFLAGAIAISRVMADGAVVELAEGVDFTVSGGATDAGGTVTLSASVAGARLRVRRITARAQPAQYTVSDRFPAASHEGALDRLTMITQEQDDGIGNLGQRALLVPDGETSSTLPAKSSRMGQFLAFGPDGKPIAATGTGSDPALRMDLALSTGGKGADIIAFRQTADYSQGTVADRLKYTIYVNDFPFLAVGDGVTNDTDAIQRAIDYAESKAGDEGIAIKFRTGRYNHGTLRVSRSDICLSADGDVRLQYTGATGHAVEFIAPTGTRIFRVGVVGLKFSNAYFNSTSGAAIYFENCGTCYVRDAGYSRYPYAPCDFIYTYRCAGFSFRNVHGSDLVGTGIKCVGTLDVKGAFSTLDVNGRYGVELDRCAGVNMTEVVNFGNSLNAFYTHADVPVELVGDISNRSIFHYYTQCVGDTSGSDNWKVKDTFAIFGDQCWGSTQHTNDPDRVGFSFENSYGYMNGLRARLCNGDGVYVGPGSFMVFDGGEIISNGRVAGSVGKTGMRVQGEAIISNVNFWNEPGLELQRYGIAIPLANNGNMIRIRDNRFRGMLDAAFEPIGSISYTDVQISGNSSETSRNLAATTSTIVAPEIDDAPITLAGGGDVYDFTPKWDGRRLNVRFSGAARVIHGGGMKLPTPNISPGNNGRAVLEYSVSGACWELISLSVNDGV